MCGRYYIDDHVAREMEKIIGQIQERQRKDSMVTVQRIETGDIHPDKEAPVLAGKDGSVCCSWQHWGFPGFQGKQVIFNARSESVLEKPLFRDSVLHRRIVVPAAWFYEWNYRKEKNTFYRKDQPVLFMAGFCRQYGDGVHFVILTTRANDSIKMVHDRMPLILEREEIVPWILNDEQAKGMLQKMPCLLERKTNYEQLCLF
ncbi:MAG: SOS response-associated peptidase [Lachnospiraceae bacterium]|nr:SOS response-associated peptidase [Lachnospiraceae bacterium]